MTETPPPAVATRAWVEQIMGMPISLHVRTVDTDRPELTDAVRAVFRHLRRADSVFSTWDTTSEIMRIRDGRLVMADADPWVCDVARLCQDAADATGGLFTTDLVAPGGTRGWDPTGLVKGWAVAQAADILRTVHQVSFSINAGGDIVCGTGTDSGHLAAPWRIGIEDPCNPHIVARIVELTDGALATSSTAARGDHILDPFTRQPVRRSVSTTVVGPHLMWADIWATATFIDPQALDNRTDWQQYTLITTQGGTVMI